MTSDEVRAIRNSLRCTRAEFAKLLGTSYETLTRWENGHRTPSLVYQNKLRELAGTPRLPRLEKQWIFWDLNIKRIVKVVAASQDLVLGLVYAPNDPTGNLFIATIKLHPHVRSMLHLQDCLSEKTRLERARRMRPVGCFVGGDNKIRPLDAVTQFMVEGRRTGADHCVLCDRRTQEITVWELLQRSSPRTDVSKPQRLPYTIIGTQEGT